MKLFSTKAKNEIPPMYDESNSLYLEPPQEDISLEDFKKLAVKRVMILRNIELLYDASNIEEDKDQDAKLVQVLKIASNEGMGNGAIESPEERRHRISLDNQAHFITKLAYCHDSAKARWFINQETRLFKAKINGHGKILDLLKKLNYQFNPISEDEWLKLRDNIKEGTYRKLDKTPEAQSRRNNKDNYFKISYVDAAIFIRDNNVYLHRGFAYLFVSDLHKLLVYLFKKNLESSLERYSRNLEIIVQKDERIKPLIDYLSDVYLGKDYSKIKTQSKKGKINLAELDILANKNFPACMRNLYDNLKKDHHLKHFGRLQLQLFLKGIGLTLEDSLNFWKSEFTKNITGDVFEKKYSYNIRFNYGKEGKGVNYTPKNCLSIINDIQPGPNDHHGCPFKSFSDANITLLLRRMGVDTLSPAFQIILQKKRENHYQIACKKVFEILNPDFNYENVGQHPNGYFESSLQNSQKMKTE